jgi:hypothetical protein
MVAYMKFRFVAEGRMCVHAGERTVASLGALKIE